MKTLLLAALSTIALSASGQRDMREVVEKGLSVSRSQSLVMAKQLAEKEGALPRSYEKGSLITSNYSWWCSGFFPGVLWQLYADKPDEELRRYAELYTDRCEPTRKKTDTHDLGFMLYCSFGQGYRVTGSKAYLDVIEDGARHLLARYDERLGVIRSWDWGKQWKYPVIIDNMMNLEMLCFMTRQTGNRQFRHAAERHADTTMKYHFRQDYSTYHVVSYDPATGLPHVRQTHQGYADSSAWARGEAWALYGYTMMFRETQAPRYLEQARHVASFICSHPRLPEDGIPYWDFDATDIPDAPRDASAAAIMASAFIELSRLDTSADSRRWLQMAEKQLRSLTSPAYLAEVGQQGGFILKHSVGSWPGKSEVDVPLTYADYYYVEALLRMKGLGETSSAAGEKSSASGPEADR